MENSIVGKNIKLFREKLGLTQKEFAEYLSITREEINYYENGKRSIPTEIISKSAKLFMVDEYDLYCQDESIIKSHLAFAFRMDNFHPDDLKVISSFKKIALNYHKMQDALSKS